MEGRRMRGHLGSWLIPWMAMACATTPAERTQAPQESKSSGSEVAVKRPSAQPIKTPEPILTSPSFPPPLPARLQAGDIAREDLLQVLEAGVPKFLSQVEVRAEKQGGRFVGWRLMAVEFESSSNTVLRPGDLVLRVNQHSLERPEQFMQVWESLQGATEIVIEIVRGDQPSEIRFTIKDEPLPVTQQSPTSS